MASMRRLLLRTANSLRPTFFPKTLTTSPVQSRITAHRLYSRSPETHIDPISYKGQWSRSESGNPSVLRHSVPAVFASFLGFVLLDEGYAVPDAEADANEAISKPSYPSESASNNVDLEGIARKERQRLEELLKSKGLSYGSYPRFTVAVKGQKVTIKFQIPPTCEIPRLIANLVSNLGLKIEEYGGSDMTLHAWDSSVAWQLALGHSNKQQQAGGKIENPEDTNAHKGDLCVLIFRSLISHDKPEMEFIKDGSFSLKELEALASVFQLAGGRYGQNKSGENVTRQDSARMPSADKSVASLESLGVRVYGLDEPHANFSNHEMSWDKIAGYDEQKREIEDTVLLALQSPEVFDDVAHGTRRKFESNRPRAVLFEGPPGTGKTSSARVIANQAGVPLLYVPLEVVMSKYYGESERLLGKVFTLANELPDGAIVFLDEVDSFAITRDSEMHEATRRILSVLLRQIDGFEQDKKVIVIAATNRKQDLDPALISRFDSIITFGLPNHLNREEIAAQYAKHLSKSDLNELATITEEMSGRDIRDVCLHAERRWASKIIRGQVSKDDQQVSLPPLHEYIESALHRKKSLDSIEEQKLQDASNRPNKPQKLALD